MTLKCANCGSTDFVDVEYYSTWFREGDYNRNRIIEVQEIKGSFISSCKEFAGVYVGCGKTEEESILNLGEILKKNLKVELIGKKIS